jgi:predicted dehydrogenase
MLRELDDGAIGDVLSVQAGFGIPFPRTTNVYRPELGGRALLDIGVYPLTLADPVLGPADTLEATGEIRPDELDVRASVLLGSGKDRFAHALTSLAGPVNPVASIGGTESIVTFDAPFFATDSFTGSGRTWRRTETVEMRAPGTCRCSGRAARPTRKRDDQGCMPIALGLAL